MLPELVRKWRARWSAVNPNPNHNPSPSPNPDPNPNPTPTPTPNPKPNPNQVNGTTADDAPFGVATVAANGGWHGARDFGGFRHAQTANYGAPPALSYIPRGGRRAEPATRDSSLRAIAPMTSALFTLGRHAAQPADAQHVPRAGLRRGRPLGAGEGEGEG